MSANRLFQIINILLERKTVTAAQLAHRFEVSTRTIYRDVDTLSSAGIPVYAIQGKGGGISLMDHFILNKALLSEAEQENILAALHPIQGVFCEVDDLILKLSSLFQKTNMNWMEVDLSRWGNKEQDRQKFAVLKDAILSRSILTFTYIGADGEKNARTVKPVKLVFKSKAWYLQTFCVDKNAFRTFKVNRIIQIKITGEQFEESFEPPPIEEEENKHYPLLRLKFDKKSSYRVYDEFEVDDISHDQEGSLLVSVRMPEDRWLYGFLLSFGTSVQVLEPAHLRHVLAEEARNILDQIEHGA